MKSYRIGPSAPLVLAFLLIATVAWCGGNDDIEDDEQSEYMTQTFPLAMGGSLVVDLNVGADIAVTGWDRPEVQIDIRRSGDAVDNITVDFQNRNNELRIDARHLSRSNQNGSVSLVVKAPSRTSVEFDTLGGDVALSGLEGSFSGKTMGGDLTLDTLIGEAGVETMGGTIEVRASKLSGRVKTMGGDVDIELVEGDLEAVTMGGDVRYSGGGTANSPIRLESMGGNIRVDKALSGISARTMGGDITISEAAYEVDVDTLGGDIEIGPVDGSIDAQTMGGSIEGRIVSGGDNRDHDVTMRTMGGEIILTVPRDLAMDIRIELKTSRKARNTYRIISDLDLERSVVTDRDKIGDEFKSIEYATLTTGNPSQRHSIRLSTIDGDIRLDSVR